MWYHWLVLQENGHFHTDPHVFSTCSLNPEMEHKWRDPMRKWNLWQAEYTLLNHHLKCTDPFQKRSSNICPLLLCDSFPQGGEWPLKLPKRTNRDGNCSMKLITSVLVMWSAARNICCRKWRLCLKWQGLCSCALQSPRLGAWEWF